MAEKNDQGLIGFDPLAWMNDTDADNEEISGAIPLDDAPETVATTDTEVILSEQEESLPDDLIASSVPVALDGVEDEKIVLPSILNIQGVTLLYDQLMNALEKRTQIEIDASEVTSADTATLQMLIMLKQAAAQRDKELVIDFPSDPFINAAELLGLAELLEVNQAAAGFF